MVDIVFFKAEDGIRVVAVTGVHLFFSSRRRHTRCSRDWSSDVCSSDLDGIDGTFARMAKVKEVLPHVDGKMIDYVIDFFTYARSEERRVGKECRSRGSPDP